MPSKIDIASNALIMVGDAAINSFTDPGAGALTASNLYDTAYETLLSDHRWTFAHAKTTLSKLAQAPLNDWQNAFQIPTDKKILVIYGVYPDSPYDIVQDTVYSNSGTVQIDYTFKPDESKLPAHFVTALQLRLAAQFAVSITDDNTLASLYAGQAEDALAKSRGIDSQSRTTQPIKSSPFTATRSSRQ